MSAPSSRTDAIDRARRYSPFLSGSISALPDIAACFESDGAEAAIAAALAMADEDVEVALRRQRRALALVVALGDLAGELDLEAATAALSDFADRAIDTAVRAAMAERVEGAGPDGFAVIAMGKLGSRELNYSSDVDLILLFDPAKLSKRERDEPGEAAVRVARRAVDILQRRTAEGYVARVDLRLRPSPEVTPIILSTGAAISHYESQALAWERAAFIRARAAAGDLALGRAFLKEIEPFVWRRALDFGAIEEIRAISSRIRDHYARGQRFGPGFDLKRGLGGIREAEFFTQVQQLIHGGRDRSLRQPAVLDALPALAAAGRLEADVAAALADAYRRLRTVEHRVQMVDDRQTHDLPADAAGMERVAKLDGLASGAALLGSLEPHVEAVASAFDSLTPDREGRLSNDPRILAEELAAMGFAEPDAAARLVAGWRSGQFRALRSSAARAAFEAMLPVLLEAIAGGPDPARALNRFGDLVERLSSGINLFRLLEAQPRLARLLSLILSHAPALADQLGRRPALLDGLIDASSFADPPSADDFARRLRSGPPGETYDAMLDRVRRTVGEKRFALGVQLITGHRDPLDLTVGYAAVAEGTIVALAEAVTREFEAVHGKVPGGQLLILALGRLGGMALTHASDLDLIFLYDGPGEPSDGAKPLGPADYFNRLAKRVVAALSVPTAAGPLYDVDTRLRPQGEQGMLAVHVDAFEHYQRNEAWTWEHMALLRARPLYGSPAAKANLDTVIRSVLSEIRDPARVRADAAAMREGMARHKPPAGPFDIKLGPGGLVDLEFAVHTLQLIHRVGFDPRLEYAIQTLAAAGLIDPLADRDLRLLSRILVTDRLVAPGGGEPQPQSRQLVAEVCGLTDWESLVAAHDEARARNARRWNDVKEGKT